MDESRLIPGEENQSDESLISRIKSLIFPKPRADQQPRKLFVIINPAAGRDQPILKILNTALQEAQVEWDLSVTKNPGDARQLAQEAARARVDAVIVNGGDGTVMEVVNGLVGTGIPVGIIPGGTMNVVASEFKIPMDLAEACALAVNPVENLRSVDVGQIGNDYFLLRAGTGFDAETVDGTDRARKDRFGVLAYAISGLQLLADPPSARYTLNLDGNEVECEGVTCMIANSGAIWLPGLTLSPSIDMSDGVLDVIVIRRADLPALVSLAASVVAGNENQQTLLHWQIHEASISADPPQKIQADGELIGVTPFVVKVVPRGIQVIVPSAPEAAGSA